MKHPSITFLFSILIFFIVLTTAQSNNPKVLLSFGQNRNGQLGNGQLSSGPVLSPTPLANSFSTHAIKSVSTGYSHSCSIIQSGDAYCWGTNEDKQIGTGAFVHQSVPYKLNQGSLSNLTFTAIKACRYHSIALDELGQIYTWGGDRYYADGFLGFDPAVSKGTPSKISLYSGMLGVSCGESFSAAWTRYTLYTWGSNREGQLGIRSSATHQNTPDQVDLGGLEISQVVTGLKHMCVLLGGGSIVCFGSSSLGQLGRNVTMSNAPVLVQGIPSTETVSKIASSSNTVFALCLSGRVFAWGDNSVGQLGNNSLTPETQVEVSEVFGLPDNIESFYTESFSDSVFIRTKQGALFAWARNDYGQLGFENTISPVVTPDSPLSQYLDPELHPSFEYNMMLVRPSCFGLNNDDTNVCSGYGYCSSFDKCQCDSGYAGDDCSLLSCFGYAFNESRACSGNGTCTGPNTCSCKTGYDGDACDLALCFNTRSSDTRRVCSGVGQCVAPDTCICKNKYNGTMCESFQCFGLSNTDPKVCSGHGSCSSPDSCYCQLRYKGKQCETNNQRKQGMTALGVILGFFAMMAVMIAIGVVVGFINKFHRLKRIAMMQESRRRAEFPL